MWLNRTSAVTHHTWCFTCFVNNVLGLPRLVFPYVFPSIILSPKRYSFLDDQFIFWSPFPRHMFHIYFCVSILGITTTLLIYFVFVNFLKVFHVHYISNVSILVFSILWERSKNWLCSKFLIRALLVSKLIPCMVKKFYIILQDDFFSFFFFT